MLEYFNDKFDFLNLGLHDMIERYDCLSFHLSQIDHEIFLEDFSFCGKGKHDGIALYQFSWFLEESRMASDADNFLIWNVHLIAHFDICDLP